MKKKLLTMAIVMGTALSSWAQLTMDVNTKKLGAPIQSTMYGIFFEGDKEQYEAAGHCAVYHMNGKDIFICHGYSIAHKGASILVRKPICWTADSWPTLN